MLSSYNRRGKKQTRAFQWPATCNILFLWFKIPITVLLHWTCVHYLVLHQFRQLPHHWTEQSPVVFFVCSVQLFCNNFPPSQPMWIFSVDPKHPLMLLKATVIYLGYTYVSDAGTDMRTSFHKSHLLVTFLPHKWLARLCSNLQRCPSAKRKEDKMKTRKWSASLVNQRIQKLKNDLFKAIPTCVFWCIYTAAFKWI